MVSKEDTMYVGSSIKRASSNVDHDVDTMVRDGDAFTVLLKSFYVTQDKDKGDNDILVRSWARYGSDPHTEVAHFFKEDIPVPYFSAHDVQAEHIVSADTYLSGNRVWIRLQISEVDGKRVHQISSFVEQNLATAVSALGAIFPNTLPFIGNISTHALDLLSDLKHLISNKSDVILDEALDFLSVNTGETPLRYGAYIFFQRAVDGGNYLLNSFQVHSNSTAESEPIPDYVVIEIIPGVINPSSRTTIALNQSLAKGLLPVDDTQAAQIEKDERLRYLQKLMKQAKMADDLKEYYGLMTRELSGVVLNELQRKRYQALTVKLGDYIDVVKDVLDR
ncbi:MAG: hypothetical protein AAFR31_07350 [Cyanobacteria bacterium J06627_8]